ADSSV
ncbi:hypothetical protein CFC21_041576, partial [Triticum aestivum]